ncbi:hypothetical protein [Bergeyella sp. RCAD1439]|uniref:hypothetical protein n=1 Tax=Bergeyella anatis TaxID=3113737 RepID=UPI002E1709A4|nr:hypothetical protein [Bergeyella sp. RCAD1439]
MKKTILFLIFSSNFYFCQEVDKDIYAKAGLETPIDLPNLTYLPTADILTEESEMFMKGYSNTVPFIPNLPSVKIENEPVSRTREYVNRLRSETLTSFANPNGGGRDALSEIIDEQHKKVNLSGGWAKRTDAYDKLNNGEYTPKYKYYMPGVDNDALNASESDVETQSPIEVSISDEHTNNSSNNLTLIFITFLIVGIIVFIIKKLKKNNQSIQFESNQSTLKENKNNKEVSNLNKTISIDNNIDTTFHQKQLEDFEKYNKIYSGEFEKLVLEETKFLNTKDEINRVLKFLENEELEYYDKYLKENIDWSKDYCKSSAKSRQYIV